MLFQRREGAQMCWKSRREKNLCCNRCAFALRGNGKYLSVQLQGLIERRVEHIYDLNNINLSIKHMDLFHLLCRLHMPQFFFQHLLWSWSFLTIRNNMQRAATDEVANIWTIDFYWDINKLQCH